MGVNGLHMGRTVSANTTLQVIRLSILLDLSYATTVPRIPTCASSASFLPSLPLMLGAAFAQTPPKAGLSSLTAASGAARTALSQWLFVARCSYIETREQPDN